MSGCGMAVMTTVSAVRGGDSDLLIVKSVRDLHSYNSIDLELFTGLQNKHLTSTLLSYMNNKIHDQLSKDGADIIEDGQLRLLGKVIHIDDSFLNKQIIVRVTLQDATNDKILGVVNVTGEAGGVLSGMESAADTIAEGVTELLIAHQYPDIEDSSWF
jgi:hypothetical protein